MTAILLNLDHQNREEFLNRSNRKSNHNVNGGLAGYLSVVPKRFGSSPRKPRSTWSKEGMIAVLIEWVDYIHEHPERIGNLNRTSSLRLSRWGLKA